MGIKVMPIVLPQFYETELNNSFWGKGFKDWTNVKKNKPLFEGHPVPDNPIDGFYDLSSKDEWVRQVDKAQRFGIENCLEKPYLVRLIKLYESLFIN